MPPLSRVLTRAALVSLAGDLSFARGEEYAGSGRVHRVLEDAGSGAVTAVVRGTRDYQVRLWAEGRSVQGSCTCPYAADGMFCKHCVAAGLAWLKGGAERIPASPGSRDLGRLLRELDREQLARLLAEEAEEHPDMVERLTARAARESAKGKDLVRLHRRLIDRALATGDGVPYAEARTYFDGVNEQIRAVAKVLEVGRAPETLELVEHFIDGLERRLGDIDDSDGRGGEALRWLAELHLRAAEAARPDPAALARRLLDLQLRSEYETFSGALERYVGVIGDAGLAEYERLANERWARVPVRGTDPERRRREPSGTNEDDGRRWRITEVMKDIARHSRDVDRLVAVLERDLSREWSYLEIAAAYRDAGRDEEALAWAERGAAAFPTETLRPLRQFLIEEYRRRGRDRDAVAIAWAEFAERPGLEAYEELVPHVPSVERAIWREKALALLRERVAEEKREARRRSWQGLADHSPIVRILLWEGDTLGALREAEEGGCSAELWLALAEQLEAERPEAAVRIYQARIDPLVGSGRQHGYERATDVLRKVRTLMRRLDRGAEVAAYLEEVRARHRRKRTFMKMLDLL